MSERLHYTEVDEIAADILKIDSDDHERIEEALAERYNIAFDDFQEIIQELYDRIDISVSPLTHTALIGFGKEQVWIVKREINSRFISSLLEWLSEGKPFDKGVKAFERTITEKGMPAYKVTLEKLDGLKEVPNE